MVCDNGVHTSDGLAVGGDFIERKTWFRPQALFAGLLGFKWRSVVVVRPRSFPLLFPMAGTHQSNILFFYAREFNDL